MIEELRERFAKDAGAIMIFLGAGLSEADRRRLDEEIERGRRELLERVEADRREREAYRAPSR